MKVLGYSHIFHALYPHRERLRACRPVVLGTGETAVRLLAALRALGVQPACVAGPAPDRNELFGVPVRDVDRIFGEDAVQKLFLVAEPEACDWLQRGQVAESDCIRLFDMDVDVPAQELSPMPQRLRAEPDRLAAFQNKRAARRQCRYRWSQRIARMIFYAYFVLSRTGWQYGVRRRDKWKLFRRALKNQRYFKSLSTPVQQLWLCHELFKVSVRKRGDVAECGCYDGASTAILSVACKLVGRKLYVCDSFEGLPEPEADEKITIRTGKSFYDWKSGEFASPGGLTGVRERVQQFGAIESCTFVQGFFCDTLPDLPTDSLVLVFEDADLKSSVVDCVKYLWPRLRFGCKFFSHEPWSIDVVSLFFDHAFWKSTFGTPPPGFYGGDMGGIRSLLVYFKMGFAVKRDFNKIVASGERVTISGSR
jgi:O-methyltransferase